MTTKTHAVPRSGLPLPIVLLSALVLVALTGVGCTPDVPQVGPPAFLELEFDPSSTPPKSYEPTILVTGADGKLDFAVAGINITSPPPDCQTQEALPLAACEFYWYMEQLDGFPTLTPGRTPVISHLADTAGTPVKTPIDLATVELPGNLFVQNIMGAASPVTDLTVAYDADEGFLTFDPVGGWDLGGLYFVAVRGYRNPCDGQDPKKCACDGCPASQGIQDTDGNYASKSIIYVLLQKDTPLTCGVTSATDSALLSCEFYTLFAGDARFSSLPTGDKEAAIFATLEQLEQLRSLYKGQSGLPDVWGYVKDNAQMDPAEVGILWAFRTHSASVIELNPNSGLAPVVVGNTEIRLRAKGKIEESTLRPFGFADLDGTVFLLDGTEFLAPNPDLTKALPPFTSTLDSTAGEIVLTLTDSTLPLVDGHQYIVLLTDEVEGTPGKPIVPSPVTVFLRTRGDLVDDYEGKCLTDPPTATPLVPGLKSAEACQLEAGRQQFKLLLDNPDVKTYTSAKGPDGLTREMVTYLYGFVYATQ